MVVNRSLRVQLSRCFSSANYSASYSANKTNCHAAAASLAFLGLPKPITHSLNSIVDPFQLLATELAHLKQNIKTLVGSDHLKLNSIAKYYLADPHQGKLLRPLLILLISQATTTNNNKNTLPSSSLLPNINQNISPTHILNDTNPIIQPTNTHSTTTTPTTILPTQTRLAEIAELIHVSSLLHDDVIDHAETRRGQPSAPRVFGSKLSVLAGDFLLARASMALSRLGNFEVIELISSIISNLVEGELIQLESILKHNPTQSSQSDPPLPLNSFDTRLFDFYQRKNYLKTASLIAKTCRATVILSPFSSQNPTLIESSYEFGKHLGLAFQIVDDILDYTSSDECLGKTGNASDLKSGLITAPGLFAWKEYDDKFGVLVRRKFAHPGDLDLRRKLLHTQAQAMVKQSDGIQRSYK
ncbi:hypothetical protein VP01_453g21 [Puccinia sorghi]|uniref:(2E,6E)-farnesyl diphosphate synthase n=1 Tax=Puccinia sorghi TaxID=27349 RepID=A0A0L6UNX4_9BASI|nr:hypothetical protein VP01_453g21 [Puccinia sorghi]